MQGQILDAGQKWMLAQPPRQTFVRSESWKPHLRLLHFSASIVMKLETADVRVYIIFEIVTTRRWLRTGQMGDHFLASN
jgi:hypothetical protein